MRLPFLGGLYLGCLNQSVLGKITYNSVMSIETSLEEVRSFWNQRPCNIRHSKQEIGTKEYFDEVEVRKYFVEPHIPKFAEFNLWKDKHVLEVGCGLGTDAVNFARSGAIYSAVELSVNSLELARKRFEVFDLSGRLLEGNAEQVDLLFPAETFDLIYSFGVLHHTPDILSALKSIRKLCNPKSEFRFMVYAKNSWKNIMIDAGLDQPEAQFGCPIANTYSPDDIRSLLSAANFEVVNLEQDHIFPYVIDKYVKHEYEIQPWFQSLPPGAFDALEKNLGWHMLVKAQPIRF